MECLYLDVAIHCDIPLRPRIYMFKQTLTRDGLSLLKMKNDDKNKALEALKTSEIILLGGELCLTRGSAGPPGQFQGHL